MATAPEPWDAGSYLSKIVFGLWPKVLLTNEDYAVFNQRVGVEMGVLLLAKQTVLCRYSRMDMSLTQPDSATVQK